MVILSNGNSSCIVLAIIAYLQTIASRVSSHISRMQRYSVTLTGCFCTLSNTARHMNLLLLKSAMVYNHTDGLPLQSASTPRHIIVMLFLFCKVIPSLWRHAFATLFYILAIVCDTLCRNN